MTNTPRTDAATHEQMRTYMDAESWERAWRGMATHARTLERELADAREHTAYWKGIADSRTNELHEDAKLIVESQKQRDSAIAELEACRRELAEARANRDYETDVAATLRCERDEAREQRDRLAEACRWAQRELGKHTRPSPIDKALAAVKTQP